MSFRNDKESSDWPDRNATNFQEPFTVPSHRQQSTPSDPNFKGSYGDQLASERPHPYQNTPSYYDADYGTGEYVDAGRYDYSDEDIYNHNALSNRAPVDMYPPPSYQQLYNTSRDSLSLPSVTSSQERPSYAPAGRKFDSRRSERAEVSYPCLAYGCTSTARFRRVADLQRHFQSVHSGEHYDCPIRKCPRKGKNGFGRKDHLQDHLKDVHMQSPENVKLWMDEVQTVTNLRNLKRNMTPEQVVEAVEMERKMPGPRPLLEYY